MSITVTMQLHIAADDVAAWASRAGQDGARSRTARMLDSGAEDRSAADEVLIRLHDLRGSIEAMRVGTHGPTMADSRTGRVVVGYGKPTYYEGMRFIQRV